jgi:hypothetical protein
MLKGTLESTRKGYAAADPADWGGTNQNMGSPPCQAWGSLSLPQMVQLTQEPRQGGGTVLKPSHRNRFR